MIFGLKRISIYYQFNIKGAIMNEEKSSTEKRFCPVCGKLLKSNQKTFCSKGCCHSPKGQTIVFKKRTQTNLEKYGVENVSQKSEIKEKVKQTVERLYGGYTFQSKELSERVKKTNLEKYGAENPFQSEEIKEKIKKTCLEKYGVENPSKSKDIIEKIKRICLEKYGVENTSQLDEVKEKIKESNLKKYGVEHAAQFDGIKNKMIMEIRKANTNIFLKNMAKKGLSLVSSIDDYYEVKSGDILKFKCNICGNIFDYRIRKTGFHSCNIYCPSQFHKNSSQYEQEIFDWLSSLGITNIERNKRDWNGQRGIEADLYLPDYNLAIEFNGIYWHSDKNKPNDYHYNKWKFFKDQNIDCIQIFENEWLNKKDIVKSIIMNRLGLNTKIQIDKIEQIDSELFKQFIDSNYIFDYIVSEYKFGMFVNDELVAVVGISKNNNYVIDSFCVKVGCDLDECSYHYIFDEIKNIFKGNDIELLFNSRYFNGELFQNFGFKYLNHSMTKRFIFKINDYNLIEYRDDKSIIEKLNLNYNNDLSLEENLLNNKCLSIYDCGYDVYFI